MYNPFLDAEQMYSNYEDTGARPPRKSLNYNKTSEKFYRNEENDRPRNFLAGNAPVPDYYAQQFAPDVFSPAPQAPQAAPEYDLMQNGFNVDDTPAYIQVRKGAAGNAAVQPPQEPVQQVDYANQYLNANKQQAPSLNDPNIQAMMANNPFPNGQATQGLGNAAGMQPSANANNQMQALLSGGFTQGPSNNGVFDQTEGGIVGTPANTTNYASAPTMNSLLSAPPPVVTPEPAPTPPPAPVAAPQPVAAPLAPQAAPEPQAAPQAAPAPAPTPTSPAPEVAQPATPAPAPTPTPTTTASPTMATTSNIDPTIQPYLSYGLQEAQKLYQGGGPQYYGGQTYVSPSQQTQTGLQALEQRASQGSPLTGAAQSQLQNTIQGGYLQGNPFFQGAFNPAAQAAESKFKESLGNIGSAASKAGRYGSGAMSTMQQGASGQFAKTLADTAGGLAYQNYEAERGRQQAATMAAPSMAQADYADIQNMLKAGQMREGYTGAQQQADIAKFNFQQTQPQQNLANFLSGVYGNPLGRAQQGGTTAAQPSGWQNLLGGAATAAGIYKTLGGTQGLSNIGNWLTGGGGAPNAYNTATQYAATSPTGWLDF